MNDFDNVTLVWREKWKLFVMRFKKSVLTSYLEPYRAHLNALGFIKPCEYVCDDSCMNMTASKYELTFQYQLYCAYRWRVFIDSKIWPFVIAVAASILTAYLTAKLTMLSLLP